MTESAFHPDKDHQHFAFDPDNGFLYFKTPELARAHAESMIPHYLDEYAGEWREEVSQICAGRVMCQAIALDVEPTDPGNPLSTTAMCRYGLEDVLTATQKAVDQVLDGSRECYLKLAAEYRIDNGNVGSGGVVVIYSDEVAGWMNELRDPDKWCPGCIAIDEAGKTWVAIGGDDYTGAEAWR